MVKWASWWLDGLKDLKIFPHRTSSAPHSALPVLSPPDLPCSSLRTSLSLYSSSVMLTLVSM